MKRKKIILYIVLPLLVVLLAAAFYIYKEYYRTHKDTAKLKPDYTISATNLVREFETAEQPANKKYWDKVVRVEGIVKELVRDEAGFYSIILGDTASMSSVRCSVDSVHSQDAAKVKTGSRIGVKGICSGFQSDELLGSDVLLVRCTVEKN
ncbi:MAG: OB-fold protein [Flavitalea sp.]